MYIIYTLDF